MYELFALSLLLAIAVSPGDGWTTGLRSPYQTVNLADGDVQQEILSEGRPSTIMVPAPPSRGQQICPKRKAEWTVYCESQQPGSECASAIDGDIDTFWGTNVHTVPQSITVDLQHIENVNALQISSRSSDLIASHEVYLSIDNEVWGTPIAFGTWSPDPTEKFTIFEPQQARFVRLVVTSAYSHTFDVKISDINIWATEEIEVLQPGRLGTWGPTIVFPLVPSGAWIDPINNSVITFSSRLPTHFIGGDGGATLTSVWNGSNAPPSLRNVSETGHDMFCSGMSFDVDGRMVVTGGNSDSMTSIYNNTGQWWRAQPMNIPRGYQGSTTTADGRIFVIGGSWSGGIKPKQGELYNTTSNRWTLLNNLKGESIQETEDSEKQYRWDNHVWLFGWKNNSIFHAGPSREMHWLTVNGTGSNATAGFRDTSKIVGRDSMCGVAAMYDAVNGSILIAGGEPNYKYWDDGGRPWDQPPNSGGCGIPGSGDTFDGGRKVCRVIGKNASSDAFVVSLGNAKINSTVRVDPAGNGMNFNRIFHHAVILPTGDTFVVGGQQLGQGFTDQTAQLTPELYSPRTNTWTNMAPHSIIRVYHSFGLLLPDARVLVGGGGLCGRCNANHLDAQVYSPPYLFTASGAAATRPVIASAKPAVVRPGDTITLVTDSKVTNASLIRYSGATHGLNNDQRRIPYALQQGAKPNQYSITVPADSGIAIPGYWMLFVLNDQGVPSNSTKIQILVR